MKQIEIQTRTKTFGAQSTVAPIADMERLCLRLCGGGNSIKQTMDAMVAVATLQDTGTVKIGITRLNLI
jgi:hypothetical protein